jgi:hypothetical protein
MTMAHERTVADLAAAAANITPDQKFRDALERLWDGFARMFAADHHVDLVAASVEVDALMKRYNTMVFMIAAYTAIEKIKRASSDYQMLTELDNAMQNLARELAGNLPLKRPAP